ncbi:hypothetical protein AQJ30_23855 [Streptomyces longwoodensis]|jgi:aspartate/methionine/tyrosine aminotransferase|uniref:Uncharacterized protein n=1 Tax=Streptomyces longwoodensis TaxID=68231 RepID=A0A117QLZ5_9ACTN|nr:hypothetical protein [Streptomyces longwoodensis]KUN35727.1 hypothetical protein AQJ30_23855 [Streptomyces longwoodensis]
MQVRIQGDGDEQALTDLQDWLSRDPQARQLSVAPVSTSGATMSVLHALDIVLNRGIEIANFAVAYASWRVARADAATRGARTLTHGGSTVDIGHLDGAQLADLLRRLQSEGTDTGTHQS